MTPALRARLKQPVNHVALRDLLVAGAKAYRVGGAAVPLAIDPGSIVDLGVGSTKGARLLVTVDVGKSPALVAALKKSAAIDPTKLRVSAVLAVHLAPRANARVAHGQTLFVTAVPLDSSRVSMWRVSGGKWLKLLDTPAKTSSVPLFAAKAVAVGPTFGGYAPLLATAADQSLVQSIAEDSDLTSADLLALFMKLSSSGASSSQAPAGAPVYDAYGPPGAAYGCARFCNQSDCTGCCSTAYSTAILAANADMAACIAVTGGAAAAIDECNKAASNAFATHAAVQQVCKNGCSPAYAESGPNPRSCPTK